MFYFIGRKFIDPNFDENSNNPDESMMNIRIKNSIKLTDDKTKKKKKKCC